MADLNRSLTNFIIAVAQTAPPHDINSSSPPQRAPDRRKHWPLETCVSLTATDKAALRKIFDEDFVTLDGRTCVLRALPDDKRFKMGYKFVMDMVIAEYMAKQGRA